MKTIHFLEKKTIFNKISFHKRKKHINLRSIILFILLLFISFCYLIKMIIPINKFMKKNNNDNNYNNHNNHNKNNNHNNHKNHSIHNNDMGRKSKYMQDNLTLVSAYYKVKSKHSKNDYINWMNLTFQLNRSMIIFTSKSEMEKIKELRPKYLHNKTVFIELEIEDFYSYKKYLNEFNKAYKIDREKYHHSVLLYIVWAEKCYFLKKAIVNNYFNSTCFYWIDSGYFRESKNLGNYTNDWPSTKKCYEDKRLLLLQVRKIDENEKNLLLNLDINAYRKFICKVNVGAGIFGGHFENVLKFINLYYEAIEFLYSKKLFIGKEQNVYTYIALSHPEVVNLVLSKAYYYYYFKPFLS